MYLSVHNQYKKELSVKRFCLFDIFWKLSPGEFDNIDITMINAERIIIGPNIKAKMKLFHLLEFLKRQTQFHSISWK